METFEFLNVLQVHGMPKIMGVLTHLDTFTSAKTLKTIKKRIKHRFWTEICGGSKVFYFSGVRYGRYPKVEIHNLGRFISVMKFRPLTWRSAHPYLLVDRVEDMTDGDKIHENEKCDRDVTLYGYVRGTYLKPNGKIHVPGLGDYYMRSVTHIPDPCPVPGSEKKRRLDERDKLIYAPMGDIGDVTYDQDAIYVNIPDQNARFTKKEGEEEDEEEQEGKRGAYGSGDYQEGERLVKGLHKVKSTIDDGLRASSGISLFAGGSAIEVQEEPRVRRPAFPEGAQGDGEEEGEEGDSDEDESEEEEEDAGEFSLANMMGAAGEGEEEDDEEEDDEEGEEEEDEEDAEDAEDENSGLRAELRWKNNMAEKAAAAFEARAGPRRDLYSIVYENGEEAPVEDEDSEEEEEQDEDDDGELFFKPVGKKNSGKASSKPLAVAAQDILDSAKPSLGVETSADVAAWQAGEEMSDQMLALLSAKFVAAGGDDNGELDDPTQGDFEDLEANEDDFSGGEEDMEKKEDAAMAMVAKKLGIDPMDGSGAPKDPRMAAKLAKRVSFEKEYEDGSLKKKDEEGSGKPSGEEDDEEEDKPWEQVKIEYGESNEEMKGEENVMYGGLFPGLYARVELSKVPCEFMEHLDVRRPILIGGLAPTEENMCMMQCRVKKHRWHKSILKSSDPLVFSLGWRRFQSVPTYCMEDQNGRFRNIKYTPEHTHCVATFFAPQVPPNTGLMGFQTLSSAKATFRVSLTGYSLEVNQNFEIVKKLKLTGIPFKIFKNTAFIKDMFHSEMEVAKFTGAKLRTVSGIRGAIKRSVKEGGGGAYRASFEDKILMSDIVFLRAWVPIPTARFFNPVMTHCIANPEEWVALRTQNSVRNERNIPIPSQGDSNYTEIERVARRFNKLKVPKTLEKALPFANKPKLEAGGGGKKKKGHNPEYAERLKLTGRIKVLEPAERKRYTLLQQLRTVRNEKDLKAKESNRVRRVEHEKEKAKIEERKRMAQRGEKKRKYAEMGMKAMRDAKKMRGD